MTSRMAAAVWLGLILSTALAEDKRPKFSDADFAKHLAAVRERMPEGFHAVLEKPFIVVGDESPREVEGRAAGTVRWSVKMLKQDYFAEDPEVILDIWLFADKASYEKHVPDLFGKAPISPYGYYSRRDGALIMNIGTGSGTLVHEIVHPFIESNFPDCRAWFNEGLASLYEQSGEQRGRIVGYPNWRLTGLQAALSKGRLPPFQAMCETTAHEFYGDKQGVNYAQARYLCYYLQERGLLVKFYREYHRTAADDPTGYAALTKTLGEPDMDRFQRDWEKFVAELRRN